MLAKLIILYLSFSVITCLNECKAQAIPKKEIESAVNEIVQLIESHYVFPQKGKEMARQFLKDYKAGRFNGTQSWEEFGSLATGSLQAASSDGHMYVRHDPEMVKELNQPEGEQSSGAPSEDPFYYGKGALLKNFGFKEIKIMEENIGYLKLSEINISEKSLPVLFASMEFVSNTKALIVDLRDNGGGGSSIGSVFESFFLPKETQLLEFKNRNEVIHDSKTVAWLTEKKYGNPLFILVNKRTFSAAEAFAFALQAIGRAKVVGQPSGGGAHMNSWYPVNRNIYISISTAAPTLPGTEISWEQNGIQPDYEVSEGQEISFIQALLKQKAE